MILYLAIICEYRGIWKVSGIQKYQNTRNIIINIIVRIVWKLHNVIFIHYNLVLSPGDGDWGQWYGWNSCSVGSYAQGFRLRFEPRQGLLYDDSGLNAVEIQCNDIFGKQTR